MNSKYISVSIENFQHNTKLCTLSLTDKIYGISFFKIEDNSVLKTIEKYLNEIPNYFVENNPNNPNNLRFICNANEITICTMILEQIYKRNQEIIKEQENYSEKIDLKSKEQHESGTQTETDSVVLSNELVVLHNGIVPNVPCNTPITIKDIQNNLNKLESPTSSIEVFNTVDSYNLETQLVQNHMDKSVEKSIKHTSSNGNESESESESENESESSSDSSDNGIYTTLVNHKPKRRKRPVRTLCVIDSSSSESEDEIPTWNECIMEILDKSPKTCKKIHSIMSFRFPKRITGKTPLNTINERCQSLVRDGRAQRIEYENNKFKYFV